MKIYLAGPITGVADYKKRFDEVEQALKDRGYIVLNPAILPDNLGDCDAYMRICLPMISLANMVVMLDGWRDSRGACREWGYAMALDKLIVEYEAMEGERK